MAREIGAASAESNANQTKGGAPFQKSDMVSQGSSHDHTSSAMDKAFKIQPLPRFPTSSPHTVDPSLSAWFRIP